MWLSRHMSAALGFVGASTIGANADMETYHDTLTTLMKSSEKHLKR
jgi:hypothetical protein